MFGFDGAFLRGSAGTRVPLETRKEKAGRRVALGLSTVQVDGGQRRSVSPAMGGCCSATGVVPRSWAPAPGLLFWLFLPVPLLLPVPERRLPVRLRRGERWLPLVRRIPPSQTYGTSRVKRKTIRGLLVSWGDV